MPFCPPPLLERRHLTKGRVGKAEEEGRLLNFNYLQKRWGKGDRGRCEKGGGGRKRWEGEAATNWCFFSSSFSATAAKSYRKKSKKNSADSAVSISRISVFALFALLCQFIRGIGLQVTKNKVKRGQYPLLVLLQIREKQTHSVTSVTRYCYNLGKKCVNLKPHFNAQK